MTNKLFFLMLSLMLMTVPTPSVQAENKVFTLTSLSFDDGAKLPMKQVFNGFGCTGANDSPALEWTDGPSATQSYAVTVYDPDAPTGSGWWHWTIFNIPKEVTSLKEGMKQLPKGAVQGRTDFGKAKYGGACPPVGDKAHHYIFTVYALKVKKLDLNAEASGAMVGYYLNQNMIAKASITATFARSK